MVIGEKYNWRNQPERLVYMGKNWSGNGYWHQFEKIESPGVIWCEVLDSDLHMIEETKQDDDGDDQFNCEECGHGWNGIDETVCPRDECPNCGNIKTPNV